MKGLQLTSWRADRTRAASWLLICCACALAWLSPPVAQASGASHPHSEDDAQREREQGGALTWSFDDADRDRLSDGWRAESTNPRGPVADWTIITDRSAPSMPNILALSDPKENRGGAFNLFWTDRVRFEDGALEVKVKARTGREDQGGGLIWRAQDRNNYYIARWNPLEDNFRLYVVKDGRRVMLDSAEINADPSEWHTIRIEQEGDEIECSLDGRELLEAEDNTFMEAGGVGLWTKADAATAFDDLRVFLGGDDNNERARSRNDDDDDERADRGDDADHGEHAEHDDSDDRGEHANRDNDDDDDDGDDEEREDLRLLSVEWELEDGRPELSITLLDDGKVVEYEFDGSRGRLVEVESADDGERADHDEHGDDDDRERMRIVGIEWEVEDGRPALELTLLRHGERVEYEFDASSGRVLKVESDDGDDRDDHISRDDDDGRRITLQKRTKPRLGFRNHSSN